MKLSNPYLRLMRLHQPVGIWLLFWPCAWSLVLAAGYVDIGKLVLFFAGAVLMRGAGCVVNDIIDRDIDKHVERTKSRPIASGELSVKQALTFLAGLVGISAGIAFMLGMEVVIWGMLALLPIVAYPFMKRVTWWPQLFLGVVFNWGALMGWVAVRGHVEFTAVLLYIGGIFLTLAYDTIYALQDKVDDEEIGVRSTSLLLGDNVKLYLSYFYGIAIFCFALAAGNWDGFLGLMPAVFHCFWQVRTLDINSPDSAKKIFLSNIWLGLLVFLSLFISVL